MKDFTIQEGDKDLKKIILWVLIIALAATAIYIAIETGNDEIIVINNDKGKWDIEKFYTEYLEEINSNKDDEEEEEPPAPGDQAPVVDPKYPIGSKVLAVPYINQGDYPSDIRGTDGKGQTIKEAGCIDCSAVMIANFMKNLNIDVREASRKYVTGNQFSCGDFFASIGIPYTHANIYISNGDKFKEIVKSHVDAGKPVFIHIKGVWTSPDGSRTYHGTSGGHFLLAIGYDDNACYLADPGKRANYQNPIPWDHWTSVSDFYYREVG